MKNYARWKDIFHYGFGYTACPYCGDETPWYNPVSTKFQSDLENNRREYCPKCGNRVYSREGWIINQPPEVEEDERKAIESIEPVDVAPVVYGRWIKYTGMGKVQWMCSECSAEEKNPKVANYCYHCGAKMDAQGEE